MGALLSRREARHTRAPGYFHNCELNASTIKELRTLRAKSAEAPRARGRDGASIESELGPLDDEIRRREVGPDPVQ